MPSNLETINRVTIFISKYAADGDRLSEETQLVSDLGIDGDDAFEFIEAFAEEFSIKSGDFDFHRYFSPEGFNPFSLIFSFFKTQPIQKPITIGMLAKVVDLGVWTTKDIET